MLEFKSESRQVVLGNVFGDYEIKYTFDLKSGKLSGSINAAIHTKQRHVLNMNTTDGKMFSSNGNESDTDDLSKVRAQVKKDLISIHKDPTHYS